MRNSHRRTSLTIAAAFFLALFMATPVWPQKPDILEKIGIHTGFTVDREIMVPMRDGVRLSTAVLRPEKIAERMPVILVSDTLPERRRTAGTQGPLLVLVATRVHFGGAER